MSETKPSEEQIKAAQEWIDREEAMQLWSASLAQLLATHEAKLRRLLERAVEWMAQDGCDCGQPGVDPLCALCEIREALK